MTKLHPEHTRTKVVYWAFHLLFIVVTARLFYWQVIHRSQLQAEAEQQYTRTIATSAHRGKILTSDGYPLVINKPMYRIFVQPSELQVEPAVLIDQLVPFLFENTDPAIASDEAQLKVAKLVYREALIQKISDRNVKWVALKNRVSEETKLQIDAFKIHGLGFDQYEARSYPEASLAAHVTGFLGKEKDGQDQGYFGIEGALDRELRGYAEEKKSLKDALGFHLIFDQDPLLQQIDGRDVVLTIRRDIQHAVETTLKEGMERYGASAGEVIVLDPKTGKILALAAFPTYDQEKFYEYDPKLYKNPTISESYEPGSTFKVMTVAAGVDAGVVDENTPCDQCDHARKINEYTIKTWNDQYNPNITIKDGLAKSDNTAMIFVAEKLGIEKFVEYIKKFGIGEKTEVELQEDTATPFRKDKDWKFIDLATSSFGQGIVTTGLQMVRAVGTIANHGVMMRPTIIEKVIDPARNVELKVEPIVERTVISPETATKVTEMLVYAAAQGEAKWTSSKTYNVAGKTGTAQVPIDGHYDEEKTIASFIGFAPATDPKFVMLVKLREPQTSPWASETAAPLWYKIASKLYLLMNIPPDK